MKINNMFNNFQSKKLKLSQIVVLDWYDGPTEGLCKINDSDSFYSFKLIAEREEDNDVNDRLFKLSEINQNVVSKILVLLKPYLQSSGIYLTPEIEKLSKNESATLDKLLSELDTKNKMEEVIIKIDENSGITDFWLEV